MAARFVILAHSGYGPLHYDLMLQRGRVLVTWRFAQDPAGLLSSPALTARRIQDHRTAYLFHEGPVSGGRGRVERADEGTWDLLAEQDQRWELRLSGRRIAGRFELRRAAGRCEFWTFRRLSPPPPSARSSGPEGEATETPA